MSNIELRIPLTPALKEPVKRWIERFTLLEPHWTEYPVIEDNDLRVGCLCFPFFLAYADEEESNEFDIFRLKKLGEDGIRRRLREEYSSSRRNYFEQALNNLKYIRVGEFLLTPADAEPDRVEPIPQS